MCSRCLRTEPGPAAAPAQLEESNDGASIALLVTYRRDYQRNLLITKDNSHQVRSATHDLNARTASRTLVVHPEHKTKRVHAIAKATQIRSAFAREAALFDQAEYLGQNEKFMRRYKKS